jgi:hypothetical protein
MNMPNISIDPMMYMYETNNNIFVYHHGNGKNKNCL